MIDDFHIFSPDQIRCVFANSSSAALRSSTKVQVSPDLAELFGARFEVFDDLLGYHVGICEISLALLAFNDLNDLNALNGLNRRLLSRTTHRIRRRFHIGARKDRGSLCRG